MSKRSCIYSVLGGSWDSAYVLWKFKRNGKARKNEGAAWARDAVLGFRLVRRCSC